MSWVLWRHAAMERNEKGKDGELGKGKSCGKRRNGVKERRTVESHKQASPACVLVPSSVWALSACDLWHRDWEQSLLPAQYCYNWQLMRLDGLSSTALNRGLHLHESWASLFLFSPLFLTLIYFFFQGGELPQDFWRCGDKIRQVDRDVWAALCCYLTSSPFLSY